MSSNLTACACQSGLLYSDCCQPFHLKQRFPQNAEQLMRSRYTAFTLKNVDYIIATSVPSQQALLDKPALQEWAEEMQWVGLEIVQHLPHISKTHSLVEFNAFFNSSEGIQAHHERSLFVNIAERWYFVDPTVQLPTNKQPCVCDSGKKFKHCCGEFL